jgi:hypothetical protein
MMTSILLLQGDIMNGNSGCIKPLILLTVVAIILFITNPSEETHRNKMKENIRAQAVQTGVLGSIGSSLGITDLAVDALPFTYNSYVVFSTTTYDGELLSYGFLGYVKIKD